MLELIAELAPSLAGGALPPSRAVLIRKSVAESRKALRREGRIAGPAGRSGVIEEFLKALGWKMLRAPAPATDAPRPPRPAGGFLLQGLLVALSNPKTLFFFGAFFPQFMDPHGNTMLQLLLLGGTAMLVAAISDSAYALLAGRAGTLVARRRIHQFAKASGLCLIGGGAWLAFSRSR